MKKFAILLAVILLTACSMKPNDATITQQVSTQLLQRHGDLIFEVVNFKKVNGISRDDNTYDAEVEYDLRFLVDLLAMLIRTKIEDNFFALASLISRNTIRLYNLKREPDVRRGIDIWDRCCDVVWIVCPVVCHVGKLYHTGSGEVGKVRP